MFVFLRSRHPAAKLQMVIGAVSILEACLELASRSPAGLSGEECEALYRQSREIRKAFEEIHEEIRKD